jgi:hypothetical protein
MSGSTSSVAIRVATGLAPQITMHSTETTTGIVGAILCAIGFALYYRYYLRFQL